MVASAALLQREGALVAAVAVEVAARELDLAEDVGEGASVVVEDLQLQGIPLDEAVDDARLVPLRVQRLVDVLRLPHGLLLALEAADDVGVGGPAAHRPVGGPKVAGLPDTDLELAAGDRDGLGGLAAGEDLHSDDEARVLPAAAAAQPQLAV